MKRIISLIVLVVVGLLVYNTYYGSEEDKERGNAVVKESKEAIQSVFDLLKGEKENFDEGKYNDALDKVGSILKDLGDKVGNLGNEYPGKLKQLEDKKAELEQKLQDRKSQSEAGERRSTSVTDEELTDELNDLLNELKELTDQVEK